MKKLLITMTIVILCTTVFLFSFRYISGAESATLENIEYTEAQDTSGTEGKPDAPTDIEPSTQAQDEINKRGKELAEYIKDRIVPVVIGVLTSASALLATLGAIKKSLNKISLAREEFKKEAKTREESFKRESEYLSVKAEELSEICAKIPRLEKEIEELSKSTKKLVYEGGYISKMISLGFSQNKQIIASGNGKKISRLEEACASLFKDEAGAEPLSNGQKTDTGVADFEKATQSQLA